MSSVEPDVGKVGDILAVRGQNLGQDDVAQLYLTDGVSAIEAIIIDQAVTSITFQIPPDARPVTSR